MSTPLNSSELLELQEYARAISQDLDIFKKAMDQLFLLIMGIMIYLMQCGFAFLEAGSVRSKNTSNILIKNLLDSFVAGLAYWTIGYAFAYGNGSGRVHEFIGRTKWATNRDQIDGDGELASFFFQFVFAATAATIVSGALAERCEFIAYFVYSFFITAYIYPVVTHWGWHTEGWLAQGRSYHIDGESVTIHYKDFAGSGIVHVCGGVAALTGCIILGPRIGRFHRPTNTSINLRGHSVPFAALGGFILLFGFMAFNGGSQLTISNPGDGEAVSLAVVNTVISGSMAAFVSLAIHKVGIMGRHWSLLNTLNGALAGMVAICAGCNVIRPWGSVVVGAIAGVAFNITSWAMAFCRFDDPLDAVAVHFGGGFWGVLSVAFLEYDEGILMQWDKKSGYQLGWQLAGLAAIIAWTAGHCILMFGIMKLLGIFRVSEELEKKGLDIPKHGEPAYPMESYGHGYVEQIVSILENGQLSNNGVLNRGYQKDEGNYETPETYVMNGDKRPRNVYSPEMSMVVNARSTQPPEYNGASGEGPVIISNVPRNIAADYTERTALPQIGASMGRRGQGDAAVYVP